MTDQHQLLNGRDLARVLFGNEDDVESTRGEWTIYGIKKANKILAGQGREELIFTGRYSTPAKVSAWLAAHPDFVANHTLAPVRRKKKPKKDRARANPASGKPQQRRRAVA